MEGSSWRTTPYDIASQISKGLADNVVISKASCREGRRQQFNFEFDDIVQVNGSVFDLERPLEEDCTLELLKFEDPEGKKKEER